MQSSPIGSKPWWGREPKSVAMYFAIEALSPYIAHLHIALRLLVDILGGALLYIICAWLFGLGVLKEVYRLLRSSLAKSE